MARIENFKDTEAWKEARVLVNQIYKVTSDGFFSRDFALRDQIRRAAISVMANIAEGFSRNTYKDKLHFYCIAQGSNTELQNQITIALDVGYLSQKEYDIIELKSIDVHKIVSGLIKSTKTIIRNS